MQVQRGETRGWRATGEQTGVQETEVLERLLGVLTSLAAVHRELVALCEAQGQALVAADVDRLAAIVQALAAAADKAAGLEAERLACVQSLAAVWCVDARDLTADAIAVRLAGAARQRWEEAVRELRRCVVRLQGLTVQNARLADRVGRFVQEAFARLARAAGAGYGPPQAAAGGPAAVASVIVDVRA